MSERAPTPANIYFWIADFLWGEAALEMPYGPPKRRLRDKLASMIYQRGITVASQNRRNHP